MRIETVLDRIAVGCAIFLLFAPLGGRTMWVSKTSTATDAAGYNVVAVLAGIVALAALAVALWMRPQEVILPVLGTLVAAAAFGISAYVSGVDVWARLHGQVWSYAGWTASAAVRTKSTVYPAWGPPFFTAAALLGAIATLSLAILWLRLGEGG